MTQLMSKSFNNFDLRIRQQLWIRELSIDDVVVPAMCVYRHRERLTTLVERSNRKLSLKGFWFHGSNTP